MTSYEDIAKRRLKALAQIKRFEQGTDPDLPDSEELRARLLNMHKYTVQALDNTLASMEIHNLTTPEDFV